MTGSQVRRAVAAIVGAAGFAAFGAGPAQGADFSRATPYPGPLGPKAVELGDLDGDGDLDVVTTVRGQDAVEVRVNGGDGTLGPATTFGAGGDSPVSLALTDADQDGDLDVLIGYASATGFTVIPGGPGATFDTARAVRHPEGPAHFALAAGRLDGDADPDVVGPGLVIRVGRPGLAFDAPAPHEAGAAPLVLGDVNGDGDPDVVARSGATEVGVFLGAADASFAGPRRFPHGGDGNALALALGDFDDDGDEDLVAGTGRATTNEPHTLTRLAGAGDGTFGSPQAVLTTTGRIDDLEAADVDGDGVEDLVAALRPNPVGADAGPVALLRGRAGQPFAPPASYGLPPGHERPDDVAVGDLTGDGRPDLVVTTSGGLVVLRNGDRPEYAATVLGDEPRGFWRLGERSGTRAADASPFADHGTFRNGVRLGVPGALAADPDTAAQFDGTDDAVRIPDAANLDVGDTFTLELWAKPRSLSRTRQLLNKGTGAFQLLLGGRTGRVSLRKAGSTTILTTVAGVPADGRFHHIAVTRSNQAITRVFLDGQPQQTSTPRGVVLADTTTPLTISSTASDAFYGALDEVAVYDEPLTGAQVLEHFNAGTAGG